MVPSRLYGTGVRDSAIQSSAFPGVVFGERPNASLARMAAGPGE